ncbi:putative DUF895 domain protein [Gregarina niphandrodes]|uniref:DUF895 domain protein n=1 Tax=Gregarina niphandrodes TaxID=110365 RepID=A0A023AXH3_GRENI|nr:putative DUF895 domain protein [Gregarina niphandrodes]EZG43337.1 putative DUF895 domain protein [Gregarina niphandrodes]|eukprot:XP_011133408.1 putative DUF895 domain protein [Gregarina niphandrodes]
MTPDRHPSKPQSCGKSSERAEAAARARGRSVQQVWPESARRHQSETRPLGEWYRHGDPGFREWRFRDSGKYAHLDKGGCGYVHRYGERLGDCGHHPCRRGCSGGEGTYSDSMFDDEIFSPVREMCVCQRHGRVATSPLVDEAEGEREREGVGEPCSGETGSGEFQSGETRSTKVSYADRFCHQSLRLPTRAVAENSVAVGPRTTSTSSQHAGNESWLCTGWGQLVVLSIAYFAVVGMWNALNTIGGLGTGDEHVSHVVNTVLYGTGCLAGFFSGSAINLFGLRVGSVVGAAGQTLVLLVVYLYHYQGLNGLWVPLGAVVGGAVISWHLSAVASGAVHYPTETQRSLFLAVNSAFLNVGGVTGSLVALAMNFKAPTHTTVTTRSSTSIFDHIHAALVPRAPIGWLGRRRRKLARAARLRRLTDAVEGSDLIGVVGSGLRDSGLIGRGLGGVALTLRESGACADGVCAMTASTLPEQFPSIDHSLLPVDPPLDPVVNLTTAAAQTTPETATIGVNAGSLSSASFLLILAVNASGVLVSLLVQSPARVRRSDGSRAAVPLLTLKQEMQGVVAGLRETYLWLMAPLFMCSIWHEVVLFNYFNVQLSNVRSRALNALVYYLARILASFLFQFVCDLAHTLPRRIDSANIFTLTLCALGFTTAAMTFGDVFGVQSDAPLDFREKRSSLLLLCFFAYGALETTATSYSLWLIGALPFHNTALANRYVGWYRTFAALGGCLSWLLDSLKAVDVPAQWAISAALWLTAIACTACLRHDIAKNHPDDSDAQPETAATTPGTTHGDLKGNLNRGTRQFPPNNELTDQQQTG